MKIITGAAAALFLTVTMAGCGSSAPDTTFSATWGSNVVIDPATVRVIYNVENTGSVAAAPKCTVRAYNNPGGAYSGFDIFTFEEAIPPGESRRAAGEITIKNEGAAFATAGEVTCEPA